MPYLEPQGWAGKEPWVAGPLCWRSKTLAANRGGDRRRERESLGWEKPGGDEVGGPRAARRRRRRRVECQSPASRRGQGVAAQHREMGRWAELNEGAFHVGRKGNE